MGEVHGISVRNAEPSTRPPSLVAENFRPAGEMTTLSRYGIICKIV